jgi:hypothetical protein
MPTIDALAAILTARNLAALQDLKEDQWFDAKRAAGYDLTIEAGRFELAKDVSFVRERRRRSHHCWPNDG